MTGWGAPTAPVRGGEREVVVAGVTLAADCAGALYWPEAAALVVADLHLEKGSSFAARGVLLPPYDTAATLARLGALVARYAPRLVIALGDSFHDEGGPGRVAGSDRAMLTALQRGRDWIWISGNHDPTPVAGLGGTSAEALALGPLTFRHAPATRAAAGEIAGHLHPVARVNGRGRTVSRRCFATDGMRLIMPAFGAYAGGLNIRDRAFADVFGTLAFTAHLLGAGRLYAVAARRCMGE
ncbi:MAG: ligase-associated DNA damage response endonuclease PdeM [Hyphomicrobiales bacterium]|nr:ligase-associated DNA damage response endonuclease PdeM [Hyphomicrobiales bacterium]